MKKMKIPFLDRFKKGGARRKETKPVAHADFEALRRFQTEQRTVEQDRDAEHDACGHDAGNLGKRVPQR